MIIIKNYDSRLALSDYETGNTYIFHIHNSNIKNLPKINENDFEPYIKSLGDIIAENAADNNTQHFNFTKSIGIVVDKHKSTNINNIDYITVLLKTASNDYVINKYVVNYNKTFI